MGVRIASVAAVLLLAATSIQASACTFSAKQVLDPMEESSECRGGSDGVSFRDVTTFVGGVTGALIGGAAAGRVAPSLTPGGAYVGAKVGEAVGAVVPEAVDAQGVAMDRHTRITNTPVFSAPKQ